VKLSGRRSGVQLHVSSLPSGRLGPEAHHFLRWLAAAGQSYWQVLPLGPPDRFHSPYKSRSAFACSPRLLGRPDAPVTLAEEADFRERERFWIEDWAEAGGGRRAIRDQVRFQREWTALRADAAELGIAIVGDMPLYVAPESVDHHAHPRLFADGLLAGAPPDDFAPHGQLWGNPVYDWPAMQARHYRWWVERLRRSASLFDLVRIDHFRGLVAYWAVPRGSRDARAGRWRRGPGEAPLRAAARTLGELPLIAEDLGVITPPVERLRRRLQIPGMAVLQFLYDEEREEDPLAEGVSERVLYTSTHDQTTLLGWWDALEDSRGERVRSALARRSIGAPTKRRSITATSGPRPSGATGGPRSSGATGGPRSSAAAGGPRPSGATGGRSSGATGGRWPLIELAQSSSAPLVMMQAQDVLGLPDGARMNTPGRATGNWTWQLSPGQLTSRLAHRLRAVTEATGRLP
jgi:4-alpha-glucanotransferase